MHGEGGGVPAVDPVLLRVPFEEAACACCGVLGCNRWRGFPFMGEGVEADEDFLGMCKFEWGGWSNCVLEGAARRRPIGQRVVAVSVMASRHSG